jgi:hypothetical protein
VHTASRWKLGCSLALLFALVIVVPWPHPGRRSSDPCELPPWELFHGILAYLHAGRLESRWHAASPQTRAELERHLSLYSTRTITPAESCWGKHRALAHGETMIQYELLWHAPLDVVYDASGGIQAIFTSYE